VTRAEQNLLRSFEKSDRVRLDSAARKIEADSDLRFFLATALSASGALENSGMGVNPFSVNALTTAHECGKVAAMQQLISLLSETVPTFYADLLKENLNERHTRAAALAGATGSDLSARLDDDE